MGVWANVCLPPKHKMVAAKAIVAILFKLSFNIKKEI
jgi:hypothetical protein